MKSTNWSIFIFLILSGVAAFILFVTRTPDSPQWKDHLEGLIICIALVANIFYNKKLKNRA